MKITRLGLVVVAALFLVGTLASVVAEAANIVILNNDGAGEGFNDPTGAAPVGGNYGTSIGAQRLIVFQYAASVWGACLQSVPTITVRSQMDPLACNAGSAVLGSAGTVTVWRDFAGAPLAATWYPAALANALFGADLGGVGDPEINATFNSNLGQVGCLTGTFFYYGLDGNNPAGTIDFLSVVLHEIGHGLGFQTFINSAGARFLGFNDDYMAFMENHGAVPAAYTAMTDAQRAAGNIADPNLHWTGPLVTAKGLAILSAGMSGGHVRLHGPNPFQGGSSLSHWSTALTPDEMMEPFYTVANHNPSMAWTLLDEIGWTLLNKVTDGCDGSTLNLASPSGPPPLLGGGQFDSFQDRGIFVTALKDFTLCSVGVEADLIPGENITAKVYAANNNTRGVLLASFTTKVEFAGNRTHLIPLSIALKDCQQYNITVHWDHVTTWPWWDENTIPEPYDIGGVIRVRTGEANGDGTNFALGHFTLQGTPAPTPPQFTSILQNAPFITCADGSTNRGAFIKAAKTISVCSVGFEAIYGASVNLTANIYNATGLVRGTLLATGTLQTAGGGLQFHKIPVSAVLFEGKDYEIEILYPATTWGCFSEGGAPVPYTVDGAITVVNGTFGGNPANTVIPHLSVAWNEGPGLNPLDITGPFLGAPDGFSVFNSSPFGKYVTALHDQELTGLGFYADLGTGGTVTARVYAAAGTVRGALLTTGTITTGPAGNHWHDIPVAATLVNGQNYDLEVDWTGQVVNSFPYWAGIGAGQPYNAYGHLTVIIGEFNGVPDGLQECVQFRIYSCRTGTLTETGPATTPKFTLNDAFPNPFSGRATMEFMLDQPANVSVAVYDVAGRKVADVMKSKHMPAGPGQLGIDSGTLASGVYFVKLSTPSKSVTRKITIVR